MTEVFTATLPLGVDLVLTSGATYFFISAKAIALAAFAFFCSARSATALASSSAYTINCALWLASNSSVFLASASFYLSYSACFYLAFSLKALASYSALAASALAFSILSASSLYYSARVAALAASSYLCLS
jgi:hypothetical protein